MQSRDHRGCRKTDSYCHCLALECFPLSVVGDSVRRQYGWVVVSEALNCRLVRTFLNLIMVFSVGKDKTAVRSVRVSEDEL
jgi:hypothetical protein